MNCNIATFIVASMTTQAPAYPTRVACRFQGKAGQVVLDQIRTVGRARLIRRRGRISVPAQKAVLSVLAEMFAEQGGNDGPAARVEMKAVSGL